jgi:long-chain fatty acid transport protein
MTDTITENKKITVQPHLDGFKERADFDLDQLVAEAKTHNQMAENELFQRLLRRFEAIALRRVGERDYEDIAQEACLKVLEKYKTVDFKVGFSEWSYGVLRNVIGNYYQRAETTKKTTLTNDALEYIRFFPSARDREEHKWQLLECLKTITRLDRRYARILNLVYHGYKIDEICKKLKITPSNCYVILNRARARLKEVLLESDSNDSGNNGNGKKVVRNPNKRRKDLMRNTAKFAMFCSVVIQSFVCGNLYAGGFEAGSAGTARGVALANALTARADDAGVVYYNPAGLANLEGHNVQFTLNTVVMEQAYDGEYGDEHRLEKTLPIPNFTVISDIGPDDLYFGFGFYSRYGLGSGLQWEGDEGFRKYVVTNSGLGTMYFSPSVAYSPFESFSVGLTLNAIYAFMENERKVADPLGMGFPDGDARSDAKATGFGGTVGILWTPQRSFRLGFTYSPEVTLDFDGSLEIAGMPDAYMLNGNYDVKTRITLPKEAKIGTFWQTSDRLSVSFDIAWQDWSVNRESEISVERDDLSCTKQYNWKDSYDYRVGTEYQWNKNLIVRAGYTYIPGVAPKTTLDCAIVNVSGSAVGLGAGIKLSNSIGIDVGYNIYNGAETTVSNSANYPTANGDYDGTVHTFLVGFNGNF